MKVGIFGGTFNPIHLGHIIIANKCIEFGLDKIFFIPSGNPYHKDIYIAPYVDRYMMATIAIQDNPKFKVDPIEFESNFKYSYQTIEFYNSQYSEVFFILGIDSFLNITNWVNGNKILDMCSFIVLNRNNQELSFTRKNVFFLKKFNIGISSTYIRNNMEVSKAMMNKNVESYISLNKIYK